MKSNDVQTMLFRIDRASNMRRFYSVAIQPNLFGGHSVVRNWGRIGSAGQMQIDLYDDENQADNAVSKLLQAKRRRGYIRH